MSRLRFVADRADHTDRTDRLVLMNTDRFRFGTVRFRLHSTAVQTDCDAADLRSTDLTADRSTAPAADRSTARTGHNTDRMTDRNIADRH